MFTVDVKQQYNTTGTWAAVYLFSIPTYMRVSPYPSQKSLQMLKPEHGHCRRGWLGGAMVLGKLPVQGRPTDLIRVEQGPTALAVGAGGGCLDIFTLVYHFSFSLSLGDGPI